ncbi:H-NS family nucleoid-associated regulatory protein [Roseateles sp. BYS78W]|uniref:H-NS family nucleoid-associated regulatory protein n=1 Tax=Pelomonas candidula TaxID=3299025 RepID=A0ABW7HI62_9BURK
MAKSLLNILSQIERLQKEAAAIQSEVITRIRKDIVKYSLTAEQLFGSAGTSKPVRAKAGTKITSATKPPKYADGTGNTWGGMGKRPEWIRQALAAGKALEDFLVGKAVAPATADTQSAKARAKPKAAPARKPEAKKRTPAKTVAPRKPRAKPVAAPAEA